MKAYMFYLWAILVVGIFSAIFIIFKELERTKTIKSKSKRNVIYSSIFGVLIFFTNHFLFYELGNVTITITPIILMVISIEFGLMVLLPASLFYILSVMLLIQDWATMAALVDIVFLNLIILTCIGITRFNFSKNNGYKKWLFGLLAIPSVHYITSILATVSKEEYWMNLIYIFVNSSIMASMMGAPQFLINKIYKGFEDLETFTTTDKTSFYKETLSQKKIISLIKEGKVSFAKLTFFVNSNSNLEDIKEQVSSIYHDSFYFKVSNDIYGIFIPTDHKGSGVDEVVFRILGKNDIKKTISFFYGVDSSDVFKMIRDSEYLLFSQKKKEKYKFEEIRNSLIKRVSKIELSEYLQKSSTSNVKSVSAKNYYYPIHKIDGKDISNIRKQMSDEQYSYLIGILSNESLKMVKGKNLEKLEIELSVDYLNSTKFDIDAFLEKTKDYLESNQIVIGLREKKVRQKNLLSNIQQLRNKGVEFCLLDANNSTERFYKKVKPEYLRNNHTTTLKKIIKDNNEVKEITYKHNSKIVA